MAIVLVVHGGAGPRPAPERVPEIVAGLEEALAAGHAILAGNGRSLDAVQAAVEVLEDAPAFNAGRGGVRTRDGAVELDATLMDGETRAIGAVAAVVGVRHPIALARAVLEDGGHVLLAGDGAVAFARERGLELRPAGWFDRQASAEPTAGTVGAVARDAAGHLAAATSTGGRRGQHAGRVGDSAVPGAGTWADDATAAVSCTGDGEAFIRALVAHQVDALMRHRDHALEDAARVALRSAGGQGGLIAVDRDGRIAAPVTSPAMSHAWRVDDRPPHVVVRQLPSGEG